MRSNGLTASSYLPVADLNPTVAEGLLDELRLKQIAAYCQPVDSPFATGLGRPEYRTEVLVRLYVDAAATAEALQMVGDMNPDPAERNDDLTWAQIVAGYDTPPTTDVAPWPVYEDIDLDDPGAADEVDLEDRVNPNRDALPTAAADHADRRDERRSTRDSRDEERFVPPTPPPLPRLGGAEQAAWLGLIGGPALLLAGAVFSLPLPTWLTLLAALGFIGGFVTLVVRMDDGSARLDDPDDGAQV